MRRCAAEKAVKADIRKVLDAAPQCWYFMPQAGPYGRRGIPDFIGCSRGRFFAIEAKALDGALSAFQVLAMDEISISQGYPFLIKGTRKEAPEQYEQMQAWLCFRGIAP